MVQAGWVDTYNRTVSWQVLKLCDVRAVLSSDLYGQACIIYRFFRLQ
jgi:hypothetical protein